MCVLRFCIQLGYVQGRGTSILQGWWKRGGRGGGVHPPRFWQIRKRRRQPTQIFRPSTISGVHQTWLQYFFVKGNDLITVFTNFLLNFWQARPSKWQPHQQHATAAAAAFYSAKSIRGGPAFNKNMYCNSST